MLVCTLEGYRVKHMIIVRSVVFEKLRFQNVFPPHYNAKPAFSNFSKLMLTLGLTVKIKPRFISDFDFDMIRSSTLKSKPS